MQKINAQKPKNNQKPGGGQEKNKPKGKQPKKPIEDDMDQDELGDLDDEDLAMFDDDMDIDMDSDLFWKLEVKHNEPSSMDVPENFDGIVCITQASFGESVNKNSRTVVCCTNPPSNESTPICVLTQGVHETHSLNLKFSSPSEFSLKGSQPSTVYLTGYVEPALDNIHDMDDEADFDMPEHVFSKMKRRFGQGEDEEAEKLEPAAKKRKIEAPKGKKAVENKKPETEEKKPAQTTGKKNQKKEANKKPQAEAKTVPEAPKLITEATKTTTESTKTTTESTKTATEAPQESQPQAPQTPQNKQNTTTSTDAPSNNNDKTPQSSKTDSAKLTKSQKKQKKSKKNKKNKQMANKLKRINQKKKPHQRKTINQKKKNPKQKLLIQLQRPPRLLQKRQMKKMAVLQKMKRKQLAIQKINKRNQLKKKLPNGIEIKDVKVGNGPEIKFGQTIHIMYAGQLSNKTVFDKQLTGTGFAYKFGSEDGIKGWHLGMKGMKAGGKRRIVVPPKFAFGVDGNPAKGVPGDSTVTYTIEVLEEPKQ